MNWARLTADRPCTARPNPTEPTRVNSSRVKYQSRKWRQGWGIPHRPPCRCAPCRSGCPPGRSAPDQKSSQAMSHLVQSSAKRPVLSLRGKFPCRLPEAFQHEHSRRSITCRNFEDAEGVRTATQVAGEPNTFNRCLRALYRLIGGTSSKLCIIRRYHERGPGRPPTEHGTSAVPAVHVRAEDVLSGSYSSKTFPIPYWVWLWTLGTRPHADPSGHRGRELHSVRTQSCEPSEELTKYLHYTDVSTIRRRTVCRL